MKQQDEVILNKSQNKGLRRVIRATGYSMAGIKAAWECEAAFRQETLLATVLIPTGLWLGPTPAEKALLAGTCLLVLLVELLNSAVEAAIDRVGPQHHPLSKQAKDLGSAAVFVSLVLTVMVWVLIIYGLFYS